MKKTVVIFSILALSTLQLMAQSADCMGLKNPTSFTFTGGTANSEWSGMIGTKPATASTCTQLGATLTTTVAAADLATTASSRTGCGNLYLPQNRFVIMSEGTDPFTANQLHNTTPDDTSFHKSIRLGNGCVGAVAEQICDAFEVNAKNCLVTIWETGSL